MDIGAMGGGTLSIIGGIYLLKNIEGTRDEIGEDIVKFIFGIIAIPIGILFEVYGLVLLPIHVIRLCKIKNTLHDTEIGLGLISCPTKNMFNCSNISSTPGLSITFHF
jgi:hypothetical protein